MCENWHHQGGDLKGYNPWYLTLFWLILLLLQTLCDCTVCLSLSLLFPLFFLNFCMPPFSFQPLSASFGLFHDMFYSYLFGSNGYASLVGFAHSYHSLAWSLTVVSTLSTHSTWFDAPHLLECISENLVAWWTSTFKHIDTTQDEFQISIDNWKQIGQWIVKSMELIPASFIHQLPDISTLGHTVVHHLPSHLPPIGSGMLYIIDKSFG